MSRKAMVNEYLPSQISDEQIKTLERFIFRSKDASKFAKKVIVWLIRQSEGLTRRVALSLQDNDFGPELVRQMQNGAHDMISTNGTTHIHDLFRLLGTRVRLSHHSGGYVEPKKFVHYDPSRTIWLSDAMYDHGAELLSPPSREEIEAITPPKRL